MKSLKFILFAAMMLAAPATYAQSTVQDIVFSEVEKRIIGEHFGVNVSDMAQSTGMPEWAVKSDSGDGEDDADEKDEAEDNGDRAKGKKDKGDKGKGKKDKGDKGKKDKGNSKALPPGLAKRGGDLPPGLQRQLDKNGRLPAGLAKRDLPADLASKLPKRQDSQEVTVVDNDVVLVDKTTGIILDVLKDVVTNGGQAGGTTTSPDGSMAPPPSQEEPSALKSILDSIFGN